MPLQRSIRCQCPHTQQEHLDLVALHHLVPLQLVLDLLVTGLALLLLGTHSATHRGDTVALASRDSGVGGRIGSGMGMVPVVVKSRRASVEAKSV